VCGFGIERDGDQLPLFLVAVPQVLGNLAGAEVRTWAVQIAGCRTLAFSSRPPRRRLALTSRRCRRALLGNEAQAPTPEMAVTPPSIRKSAPTTYAESSDAR
jgi:hypothetical protein